MSSTKSDHPDCAICNNPATLRCSRCKCRALYCSKACQVADWKLHKILCGVRPSFEVPPTPNSRRAIVFQEDGEIEFTWITTEMKEDDEDPGSSRWESPVGIDERFGVGKHPKHQPYYGNKLRGRRLKDKIDLRFNDSFQIDGSNRNLAICKVVRGMDSRGMGGRVWCGPLVALKNTETWLDKGRSFPNTKPGYGHMDMGDFREVVDYLTTWFTQK